MENKKLLEGIRVIEYANFVAAPISGRTLADWGAEVIKIEPAFGDMTRSVGMQWNFPMEEDENPLFEMENAGKKSIVVDTSSEEGAEIILKLLETADIFITNTRQKALVKSGLDYETVHKRLPHVIYAHLLGYGDKGPAKDNPAFDYTAYFARGGIAASLMEEGTSPCNSAAALGDHYAGISLTAGILAALHNRHKTGEGEKVTVSLFHTAVFGLGLYVNAAQYGYNMPITRRNPPNPLNTTYKCSDEKWLQLAFFQYDKWFPNFCDIVIERPDLKGSKFSTMKSVVNHIKEFVGMMEEEFAKRPIDEWCARLEKAGIPFEKLQTPKDIIVDPQCWANDFLINIKYRNGKERVMFTTPVQFPDRGLNDYVLAPKLGEHTAEVLQEAGYSEEELQKLRESKTIN
ncbi:MAG: CaiB/BaiF CoA-transferase family protein [Ndongobacter sp.]|nr:CaiB/BaiF CoA-transferase family protein [Ndongobacter sp.]